MTRDVSVRGLSLQMNGLPHPITERLEQQTGVRVHIDVRVGRKTVRLAGRSTWVRVTARGESSTCLFGVEYDHVDSELAQSVVTHAERMYHRPKIARAVAGAVLLAALLGGVAWWQAGLRERQEHAAIQQQLEEAVQLKQASASELERLSGELKTLRASAGAQGDVIANKERDLQALRAQFEQVRAKVGELAVSRADLNDSAPLDPEQRALYHLERGHAFSKENNLAAALIEYERAAAVSPDLAEADLEIALINDLYGRRREAIGSYRRYLEKRPDAIDAYEIRQNIRELEQEGTAAAGAKDQAIDRE